MFLTETQGGLQNILPQHTVNYPKNNPLGLDWITELENHEKRKMSKV